MKCVIVTTSDRQLENLLFLLFSKSLQLATHWEHQLPILLCQLIPTVKILNDNIVIDLFLQDVVSGIQKCYCMLQYLYGVYDVSS